MDVDEISRVKEFPVQILTQSDIFTLYKSLFLFSVSFLKSGTLQQCCILVAALHVFICIGKTKQCSAVSTSLDSTHRNASNKDLPPVNITFVPSSSETKPGVTAARQESGLLYTNSHASFKGSE